MAMITLRYDARCAECGARLPAGSRAKYYATGIYGVDCHTNRVVSTEDMILQEHPPRRKEK